MEYTRPQIETVTKGTKTILSGDKNSSPKQDGPNFTKNTAYEADE